MESNMKKMISVLSVLFVLFYSGQYFTYLGQ